MFIKSLFIYSLSLTLGIGAAAHAKSQLIEQEPQEVAQTEELAYRTGFPKRRYRMRPKFSFAPNYWHRWSV
tara:strand:- start:78 stop:290 length:213 start_codon:yes stop_codon:yes gene_type:complete